MQGVIPVDEQLFKSLLISLRTGSDKNEIAWFQTTGLLCAGNAHKCEKYALVSSLLQ